MRIQIRNWIRANLLAVSVILTLGICILCMYPGVNLNFDDSKLILMRWTLLAFIGFFILKDNWLRAYFIWLMYRLVAYDMWVSGRRIYLILLVFLFFHIISTQATEQNVKWMLNGIAVIIMVHAGWILLQKFNVQWVYQVAPQHSKTLFPGVMGNTNEAGALLAVGIVPFLRKRWIWCLIMLLPCLFLTKSLTAILSVFVGLSFYVFYKFKLKVVIPIFICMLIILCSYSFVYEKPHLTGKTRRFQDTKNIWKQVVNAPIMGYGLGTFEYIYYGVERILYGSSCGDFLMRAHNDPVEFSFNQGVTGLLLGLGFLFSNIIKFIRTGFRSYYGYLALTGIFIAMLLSCGFYLMRTVILLIPVVLVAILVAETNRFKEKCNVVPV